MNRPFFHPPRIHRDLLILPNDEYYRRRYRKRRGGSWLLLLVTAAAVLVAALGARAEAAVVSLSAEAGSVSINEAGSGDLLFKGTEPGRYVPAFHLGSKVHVNVQGLVAEVQIRQEFANTSKDWQEAVYVLPLPENAAINGMEMVVGDRRIVGKVRERAAAQKVYQQAKAAGKRAALLEQQRPNLFTTRVANIAPGEMITVEVRYLQTLQFDNHQFSLRLPSTLTPRYIPGEPQSEKAEVALNAHGWALPTDQVADADKISPPMMPMAELAQRGSHKMEIAVDLAMGLPLADIHSPYHEVNFQRQSDNRYRIRLKSGSTAMDRDFALYWRPQTSAMPSAALFAEQGVQNAGASETNGNDQYLQLLLLPPEAAAGARKLPREVVYVVDTSGSMSGTSIRQAKESLLLALSRLHAQDRFNLIEFNSHYRTFLPRPATASAENIQHARDWVESLSATGGTEMAPALKESLSQQMSDEAGELVRQVVFITDGAVGNESALFEIIRQRLGEVRLFTVGIGSAPNSHFMRKAAEFGRGAFVQIGDLNEVQAQMQTLFAKLENPLVTDLAVRWPAGTTVEAYPKRLPDLYRGEPVRLVAKVAAGSLGQVGSGDVIISGRLAGKRFSRSLSLADLSVDTQGKGIGSLWARAKIDALQDQQRALGGAAASDDARAVLKQQILELALAYQLASPYTSFVAVEETPVRPQTADLKSSPVPNAVARGQVLQPQTYPATATGVYGQLALASVLLGLAALLRGIVKAPAAFGAALQKARCRISRALRNGLRSLLPDVRRRRSRLEARLMLASVKGRG